MGHTSTLCNYDMLAFFGQELTHRIIHISVRKYFQIFCKDIAILSNIFSLTAYKIYYLVSKYMYVTAAWGRQLMIASIVGISRYQLKLLTVLNFVSRPSLCWWKLVLRVFKLAVFNQCYDNWAFNSFAPFTLAFLSNLIYFFTDPPWRYENLLTLP